MSYARWSNSAWYAFYNVNGCLSLWYDMADKAIDIPYEKALTITKEDVIVMYECTKEEAEEAMKYVDYFLEDYDSEQVEKYIKEDIKILDKWMKEKNDLS